MHQLLIETEFSFYVYIFRSIPKSSNKKKLAEAIEGQIRPTKNPDLDKLVQGIKDGISKFVRYDNAQIFNMAVRKFYSENPRAVVKVEW